MVIKFQSNVAPISTSVTMGDNSLNEMENTPFGLAILNTFSTEIQLDNQHCADNAVCAHSFLTALPAETGRIRGAEGSKQPTIDTGNSVLPASQQTMLFAQDLSTIISFCPLRDQKNSIHWSRHGSRFHHQVHWAVGNKYLRVRNMHCSFAIWACRRNIQYTAAPKRADDFSSACARSLSRSPVVNTAGSLFPQFSYPASACG